MTLVITDIDSSLLMLPEDCTVVEASENRMHCVGCFGCWVKTPGECLIKDDISRMGAMLARCSRVIIVSRCVYGGYSPAVKRVLDRSLSYVHPDFTKRKGRMHHKRRYDNVYDSEIHFYGDITDAEKATAQKVAEANNINFGCGSVSVRFYDSAEEIEGVRL